MSFLLNWPIKRKLLFILMLASTVALLVACGAFLTYEHLTSSTALKRKMEVTARITGANCTAGLSFNDPASVEQSLAALSADPAIISARVLTLEGQVFADFERPNSEKRKLRFAQFSQAPLEAVYPILLNGERLGSIQLVYDRREQAARLSRYLTIVLAVLLVSILVAFFVSSKLQKVVSEPLTSLEKTLTRVAREKNFSLRAAPGSLDELGSLIRGVNYMLEEIQARDEDLRSARENLERRVEARTQELENSLSLLHATLESTADGILVLDLEGRLVASNSTFSNMWSLSPESLTPGQACNFAIHAAAKTRNPEFTSESIGAILNCPTSGAFVTLELEDGRVIECYSKPQLVADQCVGCVLSFRDVTERRRAESVLLKTEELYRRAIAGADAVPYANDYRSRSYLFMGEGIERLIGYAPSEVTPTLWGTITRDYLMRGKSAGLTRQEAARRVLSGELKDWRCDMRVVTRSGELRWVSDFSVQQVDEHGNVIGSMGILQDITDRKSTEAELAYERDLLKALLDNFPDSIYFKDLGSRFVRVSRSKVATNYDIALANFEKSKAAGESTPPHLLSMENFAEWLPGTTDFDFYPEARAREAFEDEQEIIRTGKPIVGKLEGVPLPEGGHRWCLTNKLPWRDREGNIIGTFGASKDITELKEAESKLAAAHQELMEISRRAGMAEVATSVLHNVGNVLNSVNTSASVVSDLMRSSHCGDVAKVVALLQKNRDNLTGFLESGDRARQLITFLDELSKQLASERDTVLNEVQELTRNIEHIKEIVAMQQSYSKVSGVAEFQSLSELIEDALRVHAAGLLRHKVRVVRNYGELPDLLLDKHKVLQILINLISNAKYAVSECPAEDRRLTISAGLNGDGIVKVVVADNGSGIAPENLTRIFAHGFTTRKDGHGFGLHSGALAAREMGGALLVHSDGLGKGATFTLELPAQTRV